MSSNIESLRAATERRFTEEGAKAPPQTANPYTPGCAAATWWQRGRDRQFPGVDIDAVHRKQPGGTTP